MPLLLLLTLAHADDTEKRSDGSFVVGGGIDVGAGLAFPDAGPQGTVAAPQVEGDLGFRGGAFGARLDLDLGLWVSGGEPSVVSLVPEQAWIRVGGDDLFLAAGDFVGPWRRESVDPWDRGLTSASMLARHGLPTNVAGATFGGGGKPGGIELLAGFDLGEGYNLLGEPTAQRGAPAVFGGHGHVGSRLVQVGAGGFYRPGPNTGGVELDVRIDARAVVLEGEALAGVHAPDGGMIAVELLPHLFISPTARLELYGAEPGGALGVTLRPAPFLRLAAEANYADGAPGVWVGADLFTPGTSRRAGDGGAPSSRR